MSYIKIVRATSIGTTAGPFTIYHTSVSLGNVLASGISQAALLAGVSVTIPDAATVLIVKSDPPCGNSVTVSVAPTGIPTEQAINIVFSGLSGTQMTMNWTNGNGARRAVFMKAATTGTPSPVAATTYTPNTVFGSGTQVGLSGWFCVYNGTGSGVTVTGLTPSTMYRVMVCEYNGATGAERYNTDPAANNPNNSTSGTATATSSTLSFASYLDGTFNFALTNSLSSNLVITQAAVTGNSADDTCATVDDTDDFSSVLGGVATILAGTTSGSLLSATPMTTTYYKRVNSITIEGYGTFVNGNTFTVGATTVTVSIPSTCEAHHP